MRAIDRARLEQLTARERERFAREHPRSAELFEETGRTLLGGVPMVTGRSRCSCSATA